MRDFFDKLRLVGPILKRGQGVRGKLSALKYLAALGTRYMLRQIPFMSKLMPGLVYDGLVFNSRNDIDAPTRLYKMELLQYKLKDFGAEVDPDRPATVNFFLPTIDPLVIFGGYIAALNLIDRLLETGYRVRLISVEPTITSMKALNKAAESNRTLKRILPRCEVVLRTDRSQAVAFGPDDDFMAYSWETLRHAHAASTQVNGRRVIYLLQEYEPIFYPLDADYFLAAESYRLPHFALFNSTILRDFFRENNFGVFGQEGIDPDEMHACFSHAITSIEPPSAEDLRGRTKRKLLFYARPEAHAGRNLFEIGVMALNEAIRRGVFEGEWSFHGIGSMAVKGSLKLEGGHELEMVTRMPLHEYQAFVAGHDVGMCLMLAPHPSVPPFEMASAGIPTVTTEFGTAKSAAALNAITPNLFAATNSVDGIVESLRRAVERSKDVEARLEGAQFEKVCEWKHSFSDQLISRLPLRNPRPSPSQPLAEREPSRLVTTS